MRYTVIGLILAVIVLIQNSWSLPNNASPALSYHKDNIIDNNATINVSTIFHTPTNCKCRTISGKCLQQIYCNYKRKS